MKLPDSEPLEESEYLCISDPWRQEWERGVQVPVNPDYVPQVFIQQVYDDNFKGSFKLNPRKYLHATQDANFQSGIHELTMVDQMAEQVRIRIGVCVNSIPFWSPSSLNLPYFPITYQFFALPYCFFSLPPVSYSYPHPPLSLPILILFFICRRFQVCRYDLDDLDMAWLTRVNEDLGICGEPEIHEYAMEKFVEEIENKCHEQLQAKIKSVEGETWGVGDNWCQ